MAHRWVWRRHLLGSGVVLLVVLLTMGCVGPQQPQAHPAGPLAPAAASRWMSPVVTASGLHKIRHVVVIMQENRSFDSYFGTYPGADGIRFSHGRSVACLSPGPGRPCRHLYVDHADVNGGGPHGYNAFTADLDGGRMDGFLRQGVVAHQHCRNADDPACSNGTGFDTVGYHAGSDIPNYWAYARRYVLQDRMFEPTRSWSLPEHLWQVSEWSALCASRRPSSCVNRPDDVGKPPLTAGSAPVGAGHLHSRSTPGPT